MNFHEYQAKELFANYGIRVPMGTVARSAEEAVAAASDMGIDEWVIKAQVHAGGRGKAGGVKLARSLEEVREHSANMLGMRIETYQTGGRALPVNEVLVAEASDIESELYLSLLVDRAEAKLAFIASAAGGVDIEKVASETPEQIHRVHLDPAAGLQSYQCRKVGFAMGLNFRQVRQLEHMMRALEKLFQERDLSLVEVNPLIIDSDGELVALDAKINADDSALFRQDELAAMRDPSQEDLDEARANEHHLSYVTLDGNIGCMVNGAGLAMATMDVIKLAGGEPANFLDVGGGATKERVTEAFKLLVGGEGVRSILINIFGGIVRCDLIAEGIIAAVKEVGVNVPVVVRLEGTNAEKGRALLDESSMTITSASDLDDAARKAVAAAGGSA